MTPRRTAGASAPGKLIVLGEHAVVYGKPAVALGIDRRIRCAVSPNSGLYVNGAPAPLEGRGYIESLVRRAGAAGASVRTWSEIPSGSGLGSSAALSAAVAAALGEVRGMPMDEARIADEAFAAEYETQGRASPIDTSCSAHGRGVAVNAPGGGGRKLWTLSRGGSSWDVSEIGVPHMTFVVGCTGIRSPTGPMVEKVRKYRERSGFASDVIDCIGDVTVEGMGALASGDVEKLGRCMTEDHKLLSILGVSCNELNKLVGASLRHSYGAKLTGSGGGGSMVALTDEPEKVCEAIRRRGGAPIVVRTGVEGVRLERGGYAEGGGPPSWKKIRSGPRTPRRPWGTSP